MKTSTTSYPDRDYVVRGIPAIVWKKVKVRAAERGETIRAAVLRLLSDYAAGTK